jgi:hypothetical protein
MFLSEPHRFFYFIAISLEPQDFLDDNAIFSGVHFKTIPKPRLLISAKIKKPKMRRFP